MVCYLLSVILLTAFRGSEPYNLKWPDDCNYHPLAISAEATSSKEASESSPTTCILRFLAPRDLVELSADVGRANNETVKAEKESELRDRAKDFCESMFYDEFDIYVLTGDEIECKYERYHHCPENQWAYSGKCYGWGEKPMNKEDAVAACKSKGGDLMRVDAAHWLIKLNVFNEANFSRMWIDGRSTSFKDRDIQGPRGDHSAYRLSRDPESNYRPGYAETADPNEQLDFLCAVEAKVYLYAYQKACQLINDVFRIPAAYHGGTCYFQSSAVHVADVPDTESPDDLISVKHFHHACSVIDGATAYAVAPTSRTKKEGMRMAMNKMNHTKKDIVLVPGQRKVETKTGLGGANDERERLIVDFEYIMDAQGTIREPIFRYAWSDNFPNDNEQTDMTSAAVRLNSKEGERWEKPDEITVENTPSFVRGRLICANGFVKEDVVKRSTCDGDWKPSAREEGTVVCHKAFKVGDLKYEDAKKRCKDESNGEAFLSPIQSYREQLIVSELALNMTGGNYGSAWIGAKRTGDGNKDFMWEMDKQELDYNNWDLGEPNNNFIENNVNIGEGCVQMYLAEEGHAGQWNDMNCDKNHGGLHTIVAIVCAKPAKQEETKNS